MLQGAVQAAEGEKTSMVSLHAIPARQDVPISTIVAQRLLEVTNCFETGFEVCFTGRNLSWYCKPGQKKPMTQEVTGPREQPITVVLLKDMLSSCHLKIYA